MTKMTSSTRRQWQASRIVLAVSSATAIFLACGSDSSNDTKDNPQPDAGRDGPIIREPSPFLTVIIGPASVPADGTSVATITVNVRNPENGKPWVGQQVTLSSSGKGDRFAFINATTNDDGVLTATMSSTLVESKTVTVTKGEYYNSATVDFTGCKSALFLRAPAIPAGSFPNQAITADFNRDGKADIAFAPEGGPVMIWLGNGDGTFRASVGYNAGQSARSLATDDLNGDGKADIVAMIAKGDDTMLAILLGKGDGGFERRIEYSLTTPWSVSGIGDYDGDRKQDLIIASVASNAVSVRLGNGDGTFQPDIGVPVAQKPFAVVPGDLNRDGKLDLAVVTESDHKINVLLGNGNGTFQNSFAYPVRDTTATGVLGDFNSDGKADLAFARYDAEVSVLLGNGDGKFADAVHYPVGYNPVVKSADLDGDGKLDLLTTNGDQDYASLLPGNGDGTFLPAIKYQELFSVQPAVIADFNSDGKVDFAAPASDAIHVFLKTGCTR